MCDESQTDPGTRGFRKVRNSELCDEIGQVQYVSATNGHGDE